MTNPTTPARSSLVRWESIHVHSVDNDGALRRPWRAVEEITTAAQAARELRALRCLAEFRDHGSCEAWLVDPADYDDSGDVDRRSCEDVDLSQEGPARESVNWAGLDEAIAALAAPYQVFAPQADKPVAQGTFEEACTEARARLAVSHDDEWHVRRRPGIGPWAGPEREVMFGGKLDDVIRRVARHVVHGTSRRAR